MSERIRPLVTGRRPSLVALAAGIAGAALWGVAAGLDLHRALAAWLAALVFATTIALGALAWLMIGWVTHARWMVAVRRTAEAAVATLPLLALLALPLLLLGAALYPWAAGPERVAGITENARRWLQPGFVAARVVACLASWVALGWWLERSSRRQDRDLDPRHGSVARRVSAGGLVLLAITLTAAAFDALMSLTPRWASTMYGVYVCAGGLMAALALMVVLTRAAERSGALAGVVTTAHYQAMGKLLLTTVPFWAYIAFSQLIIMWSGGIPEEVEWYVPRVGGAWGWFALVLIAGHFLLPMFALLPRRIRGDGRRLSWIAAWLLAMHAVDIAWLVLPGAGERAPAPSWMDLAALAAVGGLALAMGCWRMRGVAAVPVGDPLLPQSLRFEDA